ncbi:MAG TPA: LLM class flavin-dependent oxidoreductase [Micromonosporaceae bacterium]|jgi:probable LLM family oxidoreductase
MSGPVAFAVDTFGDVTKDKSGKELHQAQVIRDIVEQAVLAEQVGLDAFGVGEHHRRDFAVSAPEVVLAAIAARTHRILLASAVTVLSSDDPVRVFERFATLDAISHGRAEIILGRGSFTESFPLFGYDLDQYEELFEEKIELLSVLLNEGPVTWRGKLRSPLTGQEVYPKTESGRLRTWVGVGGSPKSVVRAASYGMPLMLAIIGGSPQRFAPFIELYHNALAQLGSPALPVGVHSPGYVAETDEDAREQAWPHYRDLHNRIGRERGWGPTTRSHFDAEAETGSLYIGSPETVAARIAQTIGSLGIQRFELKYSSGTLPHEKLMSSIALYGEQVVPRVRQLLTAA